MLLFFYLIKDFFRSSLCYSEVNNPVKGRGDGRHGAAYNNSYNDGVPVGRQISTIGWQTGLKNPLEH